MSGRARLVYSLIHWFGSWDNHYSSNRSFAEKTLESALSTREWNARLDASGNLLGYTWPEPMSAVFEALTRTPW